MTNPFEDPNAHYYALINSEDQYSLWPVAIEVPPGWNIAHGPDDRGACLEHIEVKWTDIRPARTEEKPQV